MLKYSRDHLDSARVLFASGFRHYDSAAFLAHLSFELLAKAMLLHASGEFPATHKLPELGLRLKEHGIQPRLSRRAQKGFLLLNRFENSRYPHPIAGVEVGDEDMPFFEELWKETVSQMDPHLKDLFRASDQLEKGGRVVMYKPNKSPLHRAT